MKKSFYFTILLPLLLLWPALAWAQTKLYNPLGTLDPNQLFARIAAGLMMVTGTLTLAVTILGGYRILTAAGNSENYQKGKKMIVYALIGLIVTVGAYGILATTINVLTCKINDAGVCEKTVNYKTTQILFDPLNITRGPSEFYGERVLGFALSGLGALTLLILIYGGLIWMIAGGNEEKIAKAKKTLGYGVLGLIIVLSSYTLVNFIYQPAYNLFTGGKPVVLVDSEAPPPPDKPMPCFRYATGKNFGATCEMETAKDCYQAKEGWQRGKYYASVGNCSEIGACVQYLPGSDYKNRILAKDCKPELFKYTSLTLKGGACPFALTSPGEGDKGGACYADVEFFVSTDYPPAGAYSGADVKWACFRRGTEAKDCKEETAAACAKPTAAAEAGKWYRGLLCSQVGYCRITLGGLYGCRDGVPADMCQPKLFPAVGYPHRLWGCGYIGGSYDLIDGECYVPTSGLEWVAEKLCPPKN